MGSGLDAESLLATASETVPPPPPVVDLEAMVVRGVQPGPGLWKVSKGEHVLWILGTQSPLRKRLQWQSTEVETSIGQSQQVLMAPSIALDVGMGVFGRLTLLPSAMKAMKNEDGRELREVLPPDLYARWSVAKARYLGSDQGVERKRPMLAAGELYQAALKRAGLTRAPVIWSVVERAAKRAGIKPTPTVLDHKIADPRQALKEFRAGGMNDIECFRRILVTVERDLPTMVERANAWSVGDLEVLRQLPHQDRQAACMSAVASSGAAKTRGIDDLERRMRDHWLSIATAALQRNRSTFAVLSISRLTAPDGYLARLQAPGYEVEAP
ncbi:polysaccharide biosynthesis protein GumN [Xanthomonas oryzae pv. oryzae]|uniref:Polysaccharide biosynthesis protein GumN n=3 Tax=Xanthomonas oryzae TaxID=347 RepID=A0A854CKC7_XANOO|nr:TraB/GumN family protein [Xanthomonas oryzae pv. oryzae]AXQ74735.1 TraB/GumN family protein [Xanthomonas oryzae pv. oryzae]AZK89440.1 TraB/GumN family protein [Xanthomonas oryzae pv. oryzae]OLG45543.1 polysaccharide biosynthesis protein GumN [Xanthomonas oryzae pv. oryzae]OLG46107.1 polysaccharide biosynthesis protein GumN [Xanthomonas oryzae pv. oryzae]